jgi:hypothetical protein
VSGRLIEDFLDGQDKVPVVVALWGAFNWDIGYQLSDTDPVNLLLSALGTPMVDAFGMHTRELYGSEPGPRVDLLVDSSGLDAAINEQLRDMAGRGSPPWWEPLVHARAA